MNSFGCYFFSSSIFFFLILFFLPLPPLLSLPFTELEEYRERASDASVFYKEAFGVTPEKALENEEKLHQMEELVASLEAEVSVRSNIVSFL